MCLTCGKLKVLHKIDRVNGNYICPKELLRSVIK